MSEPALKKPMRDNPALVVCRHPLIPDRERELFYSEIFPGETVFNFIKRNGVETGRDWMLFVNDKYLPKGKWKTTSLKDSDLITMRALLQGGGNDDENKVYRTVATIAVLTASTFIPGAGGVFVATLGAYAVARIFPPVIPDVKETKESPTYSLSGGNNAARIFEPLPAVLGQHRLFADLGAKPFTEFLGDEQYLYQVFNFGITDVVLSNFKIGDTALGSYADVETEESDSSGALTLFPGNVDTTAGAALTKSAGWIQRTSATTATGLAVELTGLLFKMGDDGLENLSVTIGLEYRAVGAGTWLPFYGSGTLVLTNKDRKPLRWAHKINVASGQYEVRVQRVTNDETNIKNTSDITWYQLRTYQPDTADYTGQKRVALKIRASEQLQGQVDTFNAIATLSADVWTGSQFETQATSNPAWLFLYWARGGFNGSSRVYGAGLADAQIDIEAIKDWAVFCDNKSLACNLVFDRAMTVEQQLQIIARCGRGAPTRAAGKLGVVWDEGGTPVVAQFGMANIKAGSFSISYASKRQVDEVVVNFINPDLNWQPDSVRATVPGVSNPINSATIELMGCTSKEMAGAEANLEAAAYVYRRRQIRFQTDIEGLVVRRGDVVLLTHDLTQWGYSGRLVAGSNTQLQLDREITFTPGYEHYMGLRYPDGSFTIHPVQFAAQPVDTVDLLTLIVKAQWVTLTPYSEDDEVRPTTPNGFYYVCDVAGTSGGTEPSWPTTEGATVGDGGVTWRNAGLARTLTPDNDPDGKAPLEYLWFFEPEATPGKKVKIIDFIPKGERLIELVATDEDDNFYLSESNTFIHDALTVGGNTPVLDQLEINDTLIKAGNGYAVRITLAWDFTGEYGGAIIRAAPNGQPLQIIDRTFDRRAEFTWAEIGNVDIEVTLLNLKGQYGAGGQASTTYIIIGKALPPNDVTGFAATLENYRIKLAWDDVPDADLLDYEIRQGTNWDTGQLVIRINSNTYSIDIKGAGTYDYMIKARDTSRIVSDTAAGAQIVISYPDQPTIQSEFVGGNVLLTWNAVAGAFPIVEYELRYGSTWAAGTFVGTIKASRVEFMASWSGSRTYWVAAIDAAGNEGTPGSVELTINAPGAPAVTRKVIDNYVLLSWSPNPGTLPIASHQIRKGATFASAEIVGESTGTFSTIFESAANTYTYWVVGIDAAGNIGTEQSVVAIVNAPPDFVLREDWLSDFSGTKTNAFITQLGELLVPVDTTETWASHFTSNSWADPQDQVDAGYSYYAMPSEASASYEETFDYGTVLEGTLISVIMNHQAVAGSVSFDVTISVKKLIGDSWTDFASVTQVYATDFRYVKVKINYTATGGDDLLVLRQLNVQLSLKEITDSGNATANSGDSGGTTVNFNKTFVAVESITVTPKATSAVFAVYDFAGGSNPTSFSVYLYNDSGARVSGDFSWKVRGN